MNVKLTIQNFPCKCLSNVYVYFIWISELSIWSSHNRSLTLAKIFTTICAIWNFYHNFKNVKKADGGVLVLTFLAWFISRSLSCYNGPKSYWDSHILPQDWVIFVSKYRQNLKKLFYSVYSFLLSSKYVKIHVIHSWTRMNIWNCFFGDKICFTNLSELNELGLTFNFEIMVLLSQHQDKN